LEVRLQAGQMERTLLVIVQEQKFES